VASELDSISSQSELREMFKLFDSTKFGIGIVEENDRPCALVSLRDLLGLYERDIISSPLSLGDVASPIFSLPADSTLRQALELMFQQRIRRVFIDKERAVISDRKIISYIFSSACLNDASKSDFDPLAAPLNKLDSIHPSFLVGTTNMKEAARIMSKEIEECLVCEKGIVTPWDVVMKPWIMRKMTLKGS
jgi:CBS domain-containing protein